MDASDDTSKLHFESGCSEHVAGRRDARPDRAAWGGLIELLPTPCVIASASGEIHFENTAFGGVKLAVLMALKSSGVTWPARPRGGEREEDGGETLDELALSDGRHYRIDSTELEAGWWLHQLTDISELARERALRADATGRLRLLSAHTQGILFELNSEARFVRVWASNPALLAKPEQELLGRTLLETLGPEVGGWHHEKVCRTLQTGQDQNYEYDLELPSGVRHFACSSVAVPALDGSGRSAVFWIRDVTEQNELRQKLLHSERLASIGTLAAGVAHEINNPLGYTLLNAERLAGLVSEFSQHPDLMDRMQVLRAPVEMIREGMQRVERIVRELLHFSRADGPFEAVDIRLALQVSLEAAMPEIEGRARVIQDYGRTPLIWGSENRLVQVFTNLLRNAAQAIPPGEPERHTIGVRTRALDAKQVKVEIVDTGIGIAKADLARIFDPFFTTRAAGTGLGLAITHRIITSLGGEIQVESSPGQGSTFRIVLPVATQ